MSLDDLIPLKQREKTALEGYLKEIKGSKTSMANFTPKQVRGIIKLALLDQFYFRTLAKNEGYENLPRKLIQEVVMAGKGKEGFGVNSIREVFQRKRSLEKKEEEEELEGSED